MQPIARVDKIAKDVSETFVQCAGLLGLDQLARTLLYGMGELVAHNIQLHHPR